MIDLGDDGVAIEVLKAGLRIAAKRSMRLLSKATPRRWNWNLKEMREAEAMDVPSTPLIQGYTPVNADGFTTVS